MTITVHNRQRRWRVDAQQLARLAGRAVECIGNSQAELSIVLVSDRGMAPLNEQFHHVAGPTDILTFDYGDAGELIISVDHAVAQARRYRTKPSRELALYVVHGLLHLAGQDDRTVAQRRKMRAAERLTLRKIDTGRIVWQRQKT